MFIVRTATTHGITVADVVDVSLVLRDAPDQLDGWKMHDTRSDAMIEAGRYGVPVYVTSAVQVDLGKGRHRADMNTGLNPFGVNDPLGIALLVGADDRVVKRCADAVSADRHLWFDES